MLLGALVDAGVPLSHLQEELASLDLPDAFTLSAAETVKKGMRATLVDVVLVAPEAHHHRTLSDILTMIERSDLTDSVKAKSTAVFALLGQAEGRVHGEPVDQVHFHEVGAVDSIVDIVGCVIALEYLGIERLYASALPFGRGRIASQHGVLPLPAPATLELARLVSAPLLPVDTDKELVTPTGAAILGALAAFEQPAIRVSAVGVGAGKREMPWPNILRVIIGQGEELVGGAMVVIETNIDDMNPQLYGHVIARLLESGARDAYLTPVQMKKGRPGVVLSAIALLQDEDRLARLILEETTTLGVRVYPIRRHEAQRRIVSVSTAFGDVVAKLKVLDGTVVRAAPEYDDCVRLAAERGATVVRVYEAALAAAGQLVAAGIPAPTS